MQSNFIAVMGATRHTGRKLANPIFAMSSFPMPTRSRQLCKPVCRKVANLYVEMTRAFNERTINPKRTPTNITPTRFEDFADELARAYGARQGKNPQ